QPHPPHARARRDGGADQPPHARRLRRRRPHRRAAARPQGRRQAGRAVLARGGDGPHHRRDRDGLSAARGAGGSKRGKLRAMATLDETISRQTYSPIAWLVTRQTFWVLIAAVLACLALALSTDTFTKS